MLQKPDKTAILAHILKLKCPNCGERKLFKSYLKQVERCEHCGVLWGNYKADDGPAWLTIIVLGHIVIPISVSLAMNTDIATWMITTGVSLISLLLVLLLLPFSKAAFLAVLWYTRAGTLHLAKDKDNSKPN